MSTQANTKDSIQEVRDLLEDAVSPRKKPRILTVDSYVERLRTFSSAKYFAKPVPISPIECAAHGYVILLSFLMFCFNRKRRRGVEQNTQKHACRSCMEEL